MPEPYDNEQFNEAHDELAQVIAAMWPEVVQAGGSQHGIFFAEDLGQLDYGKLKPPYAVVWTPELEDQEMGLAVRSWQGDYAIYYVRSSDQVQQDVRRQIKRLLGHLTSPAISFTNFQVEKAKPNFGSNLPLNRIFQRIGSPLRGGAAITRLWMNEYY